MMMVYAKDNPFFQRESLMTGIGKERRKKENNGKYIRRVTVSRANNISKGKLQQKTTVWFEC